MTKTGRLHFGLRIMFMKEDFSDYHGDYGGGEGDRFSSIQLQPLAMVTVCSNRKVRTEGVSKVRLDFGTN